MATPTEVSERLDIPPATLRRYVSLFGEHLSEGARRPRGRQFEDQDIEILSRVRALFNSGLSTEEVMAALGGEPEAPGMEAGGDSQSRLSVPEPEQSDTQSSAVAGNDAADDQAPAVYRPQPRQFPKAEPMRSSLEVQKLAAKPSLVVENLSQKVALNEDRLSRVDERLSVLEYRLTRVEEWLKMPWYKRLLSRPPLYDL